MDTTTTGWMCRYDDREKYDGYHSESQFQHDGSYYTCPTCGRQVIYLLQYTIPEKDIRFKFVSSYRHEASYRVVIDGKDIEMEVEYHGDPGPYVEGEYNYTPEDYAKYMTSMIGCIDIRSNPSGEIPDDVLDAFRIFYNKPEVQRKRFAFDAWFDEIDNKEYPDCQFHPGVGIEGYYINARMEGY